MIRRLVRVGVVLVLLAGMLGALLVSAVGSSRAGAVMALGSTLSGAPGGSCGPLSPLPPSSGPVGSGPALAAQVAAAAGFTGQDLVIAVAVAGAESGWVPTATNNNGNGSTDFGLWQINSVHGAILAGGTWSNPADNAVMAWKVFQEIGRVWSPWVTFNNGSHLKHMAAAAAAVAALPGGPPVAMPPPVPCPSVPPPGPGGSPGTGGVSTVNIPCAAGGPGRIDVGPGNVQIRLCTVGGIEVDTTLSRNLAALLAAAQAAGLSYGGGAYRSHAQQIELRKAHCGGDIYTVPASSCSPPTAIPGHSMHEWGLAIDFTEGGSLISSHGERGWVWLHAHAATYGLRNLDSEPWHWSVNGN